MSDRKYEYQPLNLPVETRILVLSPGQDDDPLTGTLLPMPIRCRDEPYTALSYCWNQSVMKDAPPPDCRLICAVRTVREDGSTDDFLEEYAFKDMLNHPLLRYNYLRLGGRLPQGVMLLDGSPVTIGGELSSALRQLRDEHAPEPLRIWVDALCIDQSNLAERNEHVQLMGQIYANASHVHIWLGEMMGIEREFMESVEKLAQFVQGLLTTQELDEDGAIAHKYKFQWDFFNSPEVQELHWDKIAEFHRTWVIQEIGNARDATLHIGPLQLGWEAMAQLVSRLKENHLDSPIAQHKGLKAIWIMGGIRDELVDMKRPYFSLDLLGLLEMLRDFKSTLASDKIYGVLGLTKEKDQVTVDYSKSPEDVFTDLAISYLDSGSIDVLCHCVDVPDKSQTLTLPSWVPDWTRSGYAEPFRTTGLDANACGSTTPSFRIDTTTKTLHIKGRLVDLIAGVDTVRRIPTPLEPFLYSTSDPNALDPNSTVIQKILDPTLRNRSRLFEGIAHAEEYHRNIIGLALSRVEPADDDEHDNHDEHDKNNSHGHGSTPCPLNIIHNPRAHFPALCQTFHVLCQGTRPTDSLSHFHRLGFDIYLESVFRAADGSFNNDDNNDDNNNNDKNNKNQDAPPPAGQHPRDAAAQQIIRTMAEHFQTEHLPAGASPEVADAFAADMLTAYGAVVQAHERFCSGRRFMRSEGGRFGWGVDGIGEGDVVAVLEGGRWPFVLREVGGGGEGGKGGGRKYRIVGDCYLRGIMDGEVMEEGLGEEMEFAIV
ncbi:hypothetical protein CHGG_04956 [Chaetomium globosum CBS 148.51]|uniref:Heterokaryon incompatibility domain-containing protein n=1 Tax=Chaetomium globosum (strain ATCC 6205 / CBS 148.51 / DSM 1962 / NBRC 6347 / NRRL 1970) TaxID=306901 RepID=Q2GZU0_CHAGB|nr:uncharacterized protein CHGG_04956 [Chaetomium globosum CBS 148.51]EAQ88337.1 hypothetical protein CHGG_04956 [Chaetomium globosum CBS 148.51]